MNRKLDKQTTYVFLLILFINLITLFFAKRLFYNVTSVEFLYNGVHRIVAILEYIVLHSIYNISSVVICILTFNWVFYKFDFSCTDFINGLKYIITVFSFVTAFIIISFFDYSLLLYYLPYPFLIYFMLKPNYLMSL